ncbi:hypothetical protein A2U01_0092326, partial [Trifolium medium]|nr:hypothetical protein [Trifolium medium]
VNICDNWLWSIDPDEGYTKKGVYHFLTHVT